MDGRHTPIIGFSTDHPANGVILRLWQGEFHIGLMVGDDPLFRPEHPDGMKYEELTVEQASKLKGAPFWVDTLREDYSEHKG